MVNETNEISENYKTKKINIFYKKLVWTEITDFSEQTDNFFKFRTYNSVEKF